MIRNLSAPLSSWSNGVAQDFTVRSKSYKQYSDLRNNY